MKKAALGVMAVGGLLLGPGYLLLTGFSGEAVERFPVYERTIVEAAGSTLRSGSGDAQKGPFDLHLSPEMNPLRIIGHARRAESSGAKRRQTFQVELSRDGRVVWNEELRVKPRKRDKNGSDEQVSAALLRKLWGGIATTSISLPAFDVQSAGTYQIEAEALGDRHGFVRTLEVEVRRNVTLAKTPVVASGFGMLILAVVLGYWTRQRGASAHERLPFSGEPT